jgi:hypothetical protein
MYPFCSTYEKEKDREKSIWMKLKTRDSYHSLVYEVACERNPTIETNSLVATTWLEVPI